jgi:hypothetical protein
VMPIATSLAAIMIVVAMTAIVVISVLGLFIWGAIQDGRDATLKPERKPRKPPV